MYDDLVKRLKYAADIASLTHPTWTVLMTEAADAIENLEDAIEDLEFACNRYEKDYKALCEYLPKWIPCSERLPDYDEDVLVYANGLLRVWDRIKTLDDVDYWEDEYGYWVDFNDVDYWMPLPPSPEPPKVET